jgi:hypothetical protein
MNPTLRGYTLRYSYDRALAQRLLAKIKDGGEHRIWSTRELHQCEALSSYAYGALLVTVLEMHHRGALTIIPPLSEDLDLSVRYRRNPNPRSTLQFKRPSLAGMSEG